MGNLKSIKNKLNRIERKYLEQAPKNVLIYVEEDNLPKRIVKLIYNNRVDIVNFCNDIEWNELLNCYKDYDKRIFIKVKKADIGDILIAED